MPLVRQIFDKLMSFAVDIWYKGGLAARTVFATQHCIAHHEVPELK